MGLGSTQVPQVNQKALHFLAFFILTIAFYWILDTTRRRVLNFTLVVVTFGLGLGSEALQGLLPNGEQVDPLNLAANVLASLSALGLCTLYHKRMLDRRRRAKGYSTVPQDGEGEDLELGGQETGVTGEDVRDSSTDGEGRMTPSSGAEEGVERLK